MSCHSEETWESFDALWRRFSELNRRVRELEARLQVVESEKMIPDANINPPINAIYESEVGR